MLLKGDNLVSAILEGEDLCLDAFELISVSFSMVIVTIRHNSVAPLQCCHGDDTDYENGIMTGIMISMMSMMLSLTMRLIMKMKQ